MRQERCAARLRTHLEVLLSCWVGLRKQEIAVRSAREAVRERIERRSMEMVLMTTDRNRGGVDLFDTTLMLSDDTEQLPAVVGAIAGAAEHFAPSIREKFFDGWIARTTDPLVLLPMENAVATEHLKSKIAARLSGPCSGGIRGRPLCWSTFSLPTCESRRRQEIQRRGATHTSERFGNDRV